MADRAERTRTAVGDAVAAPVVDVAAWRAGDDDGGCVTAIDAACRSTGFFVVVGHGLDAELADVFAAARRFFAQPDHVKAAVAMIGTEGFVPAGTTPLDATMGPEAKERLDLHLGPRTRWPELPGFRESAARYQAAALGLATDLLRAMAVALDVGDRYFAERMRAPQCVLRLLHYLPAAEATLTTGPHTDYGAITLLATDGVPGLEVGVGDGSWAPVVAPPGSFVVNLGDMLARWTNQRYASTRHRVVGHGAPRWSVPFFINPDPQTVVSCLPSCVDADHPCGYPPITAGDFLAGRVDGTIRVGS